MYCKACILQGFYSYGVNNELYIPFNKVIKHCILQFNTKSAVGEIYSKVWYNALLGVR